MRRMPLVLPALALTAMTAAAQPFLPGITSADKTPNGCVDCHKNNGPNQDYRLTVELTKTKHMDITAIVKTVPNDCAMCHREGVAAGPLMAKTHLLHYAKKGDSSFVKAYQGACLNCHKLDLVTGNVSLKSGPKNW